MLFDLESEQKASYHAKFLTFLSINVLCIIVGINRVQLLGRVGVEPRVFGRESQLVSFPLGTSQRFKVNNEDGSGTH